jgi:hypothetical protein
MVRMSLHAPRSLSSVLLTSVLAVAACTASDSDAGTTTNASGTTTDTSGTTMDETDGEACVLPESDMPGNATATVTIRNDSAEVAYVLPKSPFGCDYTKFQIDIDGATVLWDHPGVYPATCGPESCDYGCSDGGDQGLIINPGASIELSWNGGIWVTEQLSAACTAEIDCLDNPMTQCQVRQVYEDVDYTVRVQLAEACPGEEPECMSCAAGVCEIFVYEPSSYDTWKSFEATGTFPAGVEVVIN